MLRESRMFLNKFTIKGTGLEEDDIYSFCPILDHDYPILSFTYEKDKRYFLDDCGFPVFNIYDYITPNQLLLFLRHRVYTIIDCNGLFIELIWPEGA